MSLGAATLALLPGARMRLDREDRFRMVALSVIWVAIPFTLFPIAEQHINSAVAGLLNGAVPMFTAIFARAALQPTHQRSPAARSRRRAWSAW